MNGAAWCTIRATPQVARGDGPFLQHRHAPDMAVEKEAPCADGLAFGERQRVDAARVVLVHFQVWRHALLVDKDDEADAPRLGLCFRPVEQLNGEHAVKSIIVA